MNELKGNFKAAYDVLKRAERCVLLRSKAANPSHTYAVGDVDSNGLVYGKRSSFSIQTMYAEPRPRRAGVAGHNGSSAPKAPRGKGRA